MVLYTEPHNARNINVDHDERSTRCSPPPSRDKLVRNFLDSVVTDLCMARMTNRQWQWVTATVCGLVLRHVH